MKDFLVYIGIDYRGKNKGKGRTFKGTNIPRLIIKKNCEYIVNGNLIMLPW